MRNSALAPIFVFSLILGFNDHFLKYEYPGIVTGKISDISGILLLFLVLQEFKSDRSNTHILLICLFFSWWKSPFSESSIEGWNSMFPIDVQRVIDYTDLFCLIILIPFIDLSPLQRKPAILTNVKEVGILRTLIFCVAFISLCSTSVVHPQFISKERSTRKTSDQVEKKALRNNIVLTKDSVSESKNIIYYSVSPFPYRGDTVSGIFLVYQNNSNEKAMLWANLSHPFGPNYYSEKAKFRSPKIIRRQLRYLLRKVR